MSNVQRRRITSPWDAGLLWKIVCHLITALVQLNPEQFLPQVQPDQLERRKRTDCSAVCISYIHSWEADRLLWKSLKCCESGLALTQGVNYCYQDRTFSALTPWNLWFLVLHCKLKPEKEHALPWKQGKQTFLPDLLLKSSMSHAFSSQRDATKFNNFLCLLHLVEAICILSCSLTHGVQNN